MSVDTSPQAHPRDRLKRELSLTDATLLVVASVVGSGIFFTPGLVADRLPHPAWILAAWGLGGLLSLAGALANGELGAMFPRAGGDYVFLRAAFHPVAGFLVGWLTFFAIYAGTIAVLARAFADGLSALMGWPHELSLSLAVGLIVIVSVLNYVGVRWGARANNLTTAIKIAALLALVVLGPLFGDGDWSRLLRSSHATAPFSSLSFGLAMSPILFSYLGWNASIYVASEIRAPGRNVPRSLFIGLGICVAIYLLMNGIYLYGLPMETLRGVENAGEAVARALFGSVGGSLLAGFVLLSILGTLNATILVGPRIAYAMSLDGLFFRGAERVHEDFRTPGVSIALQAAVAVGLLLILRTFPRALDFTTFAIVLATMADVAALYRLRRTQAARPRPYRVWGYPWVPGAYLVVNGAIALSLLWGRPAECAVAVLVLVGGVPFYWFFTSGRRPSPVS